MPASASHKVVYVALGGNLMIALPANSFTVPLTACLVHSLRFRP